MGRVNDWAVNKDSDGIVYCFADGTTQVVCLEDYLRENPEYTAADFRRIKEISDSMFFEQHQTDYRYSYMKTDADFDDVAAALPVSDPEPCAALLQREQRRLAVQAALLLLHSGELTPAQKERFIDYFLHGKSISEIARKNNIQRPSAWESVHRLGKLLSSRAVI